jgi:polyisoprenoid-binding protein YceI
VQFALLAILASDRSHRVFVASFAQSRATQSPTDNIMITTRNRPILSTLVLSLALVSTAACKSEVDEKPKAKVEDAEKAPEKAPDGGKAPDEVKADSKTLALVTEGSSIGFIGAKMTGDHKGGFEKFSGSATVEGGKVVSMSIVIEMDSMTSDAADLTGHLKNADFFDVATHPQAKFDSLSITEKAGENGATHEIAGNLEMKSQAKKVTFPATLEVSDAGVHGKAEFSINRKDWGIVYAGKPDDLIKDDVALILDLNFK